MKIEVVKQTSIKYTLSYNGNKIYQNYYTEKEADNYKNFIETLAKNKTSKPVSYSFLDLSKYDDSLYNEYLYLFPDTTGDCFINVSFTKLSSNKKSKILCSYLPLDGDLSVAYSLISPLDKKYWHNNELSKENKILIAKFYKNLAPYPELLDLIKSIDKGCGLTIRSFNPAYKRIFD